MSAAKMFPQEEIEQQQELLAIHRRSLAHLLRQASQYGGEVNAPVVTANGIHEARENISRIKTILRGQGIDVQDQADDVASEPPPYAPHLYPANSYLLQFLKLLRDWWLSILVVVTSIVTLIVLLRWTDLIAIKLGMFWAVLGAGFAWLLGCVYIGFRRSSAVSVSGHGKNKGINKRHFFVTWLQRLKVRRLKGEQKFPQQWRRAAYIGIASASLIAVIETAYYLVDQDAPSDKTRILVADFVGPNLQGTTMTQYIMTDLKASMDPYKDMDIKPRGRAIRDPQGSEIARYVGKQHNAAVVIWGWYDRSEPEKEVSVSIHFEVLNAPEQLPDLNPEAKGKVQIFSSTGFSLQTKLSEQTIFLSLVTAATVRYAAKDWKGAIDRYTDALNQTKEEVPGLDRGKVLALRGTAFLLNGNLQRSIEDFNQAITLDPNNAHAYGGRSTAYYMKGDSYSASTDCDKLLNLDSAEYEALTNCGSYYMSVGKLDLALAPLERAIQMNPTSSHAYINRGTVYLLKDEYDRSIADYDQGIALEPNVSEYHYNRGLSYLQVQEYDKAISDFERSIQLNQDNYQAFRKIGLAYSIQGNLDQAITEFDQSIKLQPNDEAYANRASAYWRKGNTDQAIADYKRAISVNLNYFNVYHDLANLYHTRNEIDNEIAVFDQLLALKPDDYMAHINRGFAYYTKGDFDHAVEDDERAVNIQPGNALGYYNRGVAYAAKGEKDKARADYQKVLDISTDSSLREKASDNLAGLQAK